jgi:tRNA 2-thiouridine synthesizing protein A
MATITLNCLGMKCPQPILKVSVEAVKMKPGDICEVTADCSTFEKDIKSWCERTKKTLLFCRNEGEGKFRAQIQF